MRFVALRSSRLGALRYPSAQNPKSPVADIRNTVTNRYTLLVYFSREYDIMRLYAYAYFIESLKK
jgi:hypothetical protein